MEGKEELTVRTEVVEPTAGLAGAMGLSQVRTASTVPSTHRSQGHPPGAAGRLSAAAS